MSARSLKSIRRFVLSVLTIALTSAVSVQAGGSSPDTVTTSVQTAPWEFSVGGYYYSLPFDEDFLIAVVRAQRGSLHLEARYNYEDFRTGSLFAGWTFSTGESFTAALTPMAGVAFGQTTGVVPALEAELAYGIADLYLESEYLLDLNEQTDSFFYTWLELGFSPGGLFRAGLVAQRTRLFQTPLELDRGPFVQATPGVGSVSVYAFNLFTDSWFLVIGLQVDW